MSLIGILLSRPPRDRILLSYRLGTYKIGSYVYTSYRMELDMDELHGRGTTLGTFLSPKMHIGS